MIFSLKSLALKKLCLLTIGSMMTSISKTTMKPETFAVLSPHDVHYKTNDNEDTSRTLPFHTLGKVRIGDMVRLLKPRPTQKEQEKVNLETKQIVHG